MKRKKKKRVKLNAAPSFRIDYCVASNHLSKSVFCIWGNLQENARLTERIQPFCIVCSGSFISVILWIQFWNEWVHVKDVLQAKETNDVVAQVGRQTMAKINNIKYLIVKCKVYLLGSASLLIFIFLRLNTPNNLKIDYGKKNKKKEKRCRKKEQ